MPFRAFFLQYAFFFTLNASVAFFIAVLIAVLFSFVLFITVPVAARIRVLFSILVFIFCHKKSLPFFTFSIISLYDNFYTLRLQYLKKNKINDIISSNYYGSLVCRRSFGSTVTDN